MKQKRGYVMDTLIVNWITYLSGIKRYSPHTTSSYAHDVRQFLNFMQLYKGNLLTLDDLGKLTLSDLRAWLSDRLAQNYSHRSTARAVSASRSFCKFLTRQYGIEISAIDLLQSARIKKQLPRPLSIEQIRQLLSEIELQSGDVWIGLRDKALFTLLYATGLRISEALSLKGDVLIQSKYITVVGKGGKERVIPMVEAVHQALTDYARACPYPIVQSTPLFLGSKGNVLNPGIAQQTLRRYRQNLGLPDSVTPHALRHSCATHLMESSSDLRAIQELLGHASLSSTQVYTKLEQKQLMSSFMKAHPRSQ